MSGEYVLVARKPRRKIPWGWALALVFAVWALAATYLAIELHERPAAIQAPEYGDCLSPYVAVPGRPCLEPTNLLIAKGQPPICGCVDKEGLQAPTGFGRGGNVI